MSMRVKLGLGGAGLLVIGIWCPDVDLAYNLGSQSFWHEGVAVPFILFGLAMYGALGVIVNSRKAVLMAGGITAAGLAALYMHHTSERWDFTVAQLSWGWIVLAVGSVLLLASGMFPRRKSRQLTTQPGGNGWPAPR